MSNETSEKKPNTTNPMFADFVFDPEQHRDIDMSGAHLTVIRNHIVIWFSNPVPNSLLSYYQADNGTIKVDVHINIRQDYLEDKTNIFRPSTVQQTLRKNWRYCLRHPRWALDVVKRSVAL